MQRLFWAALCSVMFLLVVTAGTVQAYEDDGARMSKGGTYYVPAYSHVYYGNKDRVLQLTTTLSIRNTDMKQGIVITSVGYYNNDGTIIQEYVDAPIAMKPLESYRFIVPERDVKGGFGANFIVVWHADAPANTPIIESIMIGTISGQGISFKSRGKEIVP